MHAPTIDVIREMTVANVGSSHAERMALIILFEAAVPLPTGMVAERIGMSKGAMTSIANRMVDGELVIRRIEPSDRRSIYLELTKSAERELRRAEKRSGYVRDVV
jgi:DNA-binding MarR family transcriptional regulator